MWHAKRKIVNVNPRFLHGQNIESMEPSHALEVDHHLLMSATTDATKPTIIPPQPSNAKLKVVKSLFSEPICWRGIWRDSMYTESGKCSRLTFFRHNMPGEISTVRSHYSQRSVSETSASPSRASMSAAHVPQQSPTSTTPQSAGAMSIGSIIEHGHGMQQQHEFRHHSSVSSLHDLAHTPIGTTPRSLPPELLYGLSAPGDSPLYSSSDSSYSPISDYLQPQAVPHSFYSPDMGIQRPHSANVECYQPMAHSPMAPSPLSVGPPTPSWSYDAAAIGFAPEQQPPCISSVSLEDSKLDGLGDANFALTAPTISLRFTLLDRRQ